jgi:hypothetical protein
VAGYVARIERETQNNSYFRRVLFTGVHSQFVVMRLQFGGAISDGILLVSGPGGPTGPTCESRFNSEIQLPQAGLFFVEFSTRGSR